MYAQVETPKENKSRAVANSISQKKSIGNQGFRFVDNRTEAVTQRKLHNSMQYSRRYRGVNDQTGNLSVMQCILDYGSQEKDIRTASVEKLKEILEK